ncbi:MAG: shikimate kinase [Lachnospiraceae bacterium]|nr:shikimate kinase [Lachnospiraceae bacterium]MDY3729464.1 shikimate kinase [Candidatus Choladocola sp.]
MKENIFLIGFMGAGKSTVARAMKKHYGMRLIEMDEQIEYQEKMSVPKIFEVHGEPYFRKLETDLLEGLSSQENTVVSCGGGVPMRACNVEAMRKSGKVIYLRTSPQQIYERVKTSHNRPLLEGNMNVEYISKLLSQRLPKYLEAADAVVSTDGKRVEDICKEIIGLISETE